MDKQEERRVFDMAKQDVPFLKHLELVTHDDRPDFVLKDEYGRKIGLEHFRADVFRAQDKNGSHVSGGHTVLNKSKGEIYQKYHHNTARGTWTDELIENAANDFFSGQIRDSLDMQSNYTYEAFLDNLHVGVHGKQSKREVKGHIQKSQNYPDRESYDLMGFLIEIPVPSFQYYFETADSRQMCQHISLPCPLNLQEPDRLPRRHYRACSCQKINGIPITDEIWKELDVFDDIDFIIIETYDEKHPQEHHGQYFNKDTPKPQIYPAFSFGLTNVESTDIQTEHKDGKINVTIKAKMNWTKHNVLITNSKLKAERRKQTRKTRKSFDKNAKNLLEK